MFKRHISILIFCQLLFSWLAVYLISKISLIGKIGIATFHKEYKVLRSGWKTFLLFFGIQLIVILLLSFLQKKLSRRNTILSTSILLALAVLGLWITYYDFQYTYSHRLLKERFHLGFYFFWIGLMGTCVFFLITTRKNSAEAIPWPEDKNIPEEKIS